MNKFIGIFTSRRLMLLHTLLTAILIGVTGSAAAQGVSYFPDKRVKKVYISSEPIVLKGNSHVGTILLRKSYPLDRITSNENQRFYGEFYGKWGGVSASNILPTNIPGIGIRFSHEINGNISVTYPFSASKQNVNIDNIVVEIVQTAEDTGTGAISPGPYTSLFVNQDSHKERLLETYIQPNGIMIVTSSCQIDAGSRNIIVKMPEVKVGDFHGIGSTASESDASIKVKCSSGYGNNPSLRNVMAGKVRVSFSYEPDPVNVPGVIAPEINSDTADGVSIQLKNTGSNEPIRPHESIEVGRNYLDGDNVFTLPIKARYFQTKRKVQPGNVKATAYFDIIYN